MGKYGFRMDLDEYSTTGKHVRKIAPESTVLEFGCAEGRMTRYLKEALNCRVFIVEIDRPSFEKALAYADGGLCCDAESLAWVDELGEVQFDYIIFSDVLEHLKLPETVLKAAGNLLKADGQVLVSIPNIGHGDIICSLLCNRFHYTSVGLLDNTHVHFWGHADFIEFARNCGFSVVEEDAIYLGVNASEQAQYSAGLPNSIRNEIASFPYSGVYEFVFVLRKREYAEKNGLLMVSHIKTETERAFNMLGHLFFDTGEGFSEEEAKTITVNPDGCYSQRIKLPPNCRSVRFDPMEGVTGCVWDVHACTPGKSLSIQFTNGHRFGQAILFQTIDPQIEFEPLEPNSPWIELHALVREFDGPAWVELCEQAIAREKENLQLTERLECSEAQRENTSKSLEVALGEVNRVESERVALAQARDELLRERDDLTQAHNNLLRERDDLTQAHNNLLRERDDLAQAYNELIHERDGLTQALSELSGQRDDLEREREQISAQRDAIREELTRVEGLRQTERQESVREMDCQKERYMALVNQQNELSLRLSNLQESYNAISDAQLWKMTAPLRKLLDGIKGTRAGFLTHKAARHWRMYGFKLTLIKVKECVNKSNSIVSTRSEEKHLLNQSEVTDQSNISRVNNNFKDFLNECQMRGRVFGLDLLDGSTDDNRVLMVSHVLNLTGAPIALLYLAQNLKKRGMVPVFIAPEDDRLRERIVREGISVITVGDIYESDLVARSVSLFKLIVINTIVGGPLIQQLSGKQTPVLWWIHEAKVSYHLGAVRGMPEQVGPNIHIYCMGKQSEKWLQMYRPDYANDILLYCQPDFSKLDTQGRNIILPSTNGKTVFLMVGMLEERKGQDILADAIKLLPEDEIKECLFVFVGHQYYKIAFDKIKEIEMRYPNNVKYLGEVDIEDMPSLYQRCDCLICPSRDDTGPITVTEAMVLSKIVICSANTGNAALLELEKSGLIYHNDDPEALAEQILNVAHNKGSMDSLREAARKTYEKYFSEAAFDESITRILNKIFKSIDEPECLPVKVSVIVPVYNGGDDLKKLVEAINNQQGIESIEMVIVDSGSKDGSAEYAEEMGAKVIRINQSEFSHSYARNLGAENANGDYMLIMTQDAYPDGPYWIRGMLRPVLYQGVVAVSCQEKPKPDCDLLGRTNIFNHSSYMGILEGDRILQMPVDVNNDTLRKNAQLNDVACLIRKDVFDRYHYRRNYAEDLDLGLRLIRDGHKLALLSSVQVIHSHTRPSMYHFKRGIVDVSTLNYVLPGSVTANCTEEYVTNRILTAYCVIKLYVRAAQKYTMAKEGPEAWSNFCNWTAKEIKDDLQRVKNMKAKAKKALIKSNESIFDVNYQKVILEMLAIRQGDFSIEPTTVNEIRYYLVEVLSNYFAYSHVYFTKTEKDEICVLAEKLTGLCGGNLVGTYAAMHENEKSGLMELSEKYNKGV